MGLLSPEDADKLQIKEKDPFIEVGKAGVEKAANVRLMGKNGVRTAQVNSLGREVEDPKLRLPGVGLIEEPVSGKPLTLNLDMDLQTIVENGFAGETGSAVFMNPNTGEILAWVSVPEFNPNLFSKAVSASDWQALVEDPGQAAFEPAHSGRLPAGIHLQTLRGPRGPSGGNSHRKHGLLLRWSVGLWRPSVPLLEQGPWRRGHADGHPELMQHLLLPRRR